MGWSQELLHVRATALCLCLVPSLGAQNLTRIAPDKCNECKIEVVSRGNLALKSVELVRSVRARRMPTGYTVITDAFGRGTYVVVDSQGRVISTRSASGGGPGEFRQIDFVEPCRGDSLLVYDGVARRFSVLTRRGEYWRSFPFLGLVSSAVCTPQQIVLWGGSPNKPRGTTRLIVMDYTGNVVVEHEAQLSDGTTGGFMRAYRLLAMAGSNTALTIPAESYALEQFDLTDGSQRILVRELDWFPRRPTGSQRLPPWVARPTPRVSSFQIDREGRLWTLIVAAHPNWKKADQFSLQKPPSLNEKEKYFQAIVEVVDPRTATAIASVQLPGSVTGFLDDSTVYALRERDDGTLAIAVWMLRLTPPRR